MLNRHTGPSRQSLSAALMVVLVSSTAAPSVAAAQQGSPVKPLFEMFATYGRPPVPTAVAEAYAPAGGIRAGGGVGGAVGVMLRHVELAAFYEFGTASVARSTAGSARDFTRSVTGLRLEVPLMEFGSSFRGLTSASAFMQTMEEVTVPRATGTGVLSLTQRQAIGGRLELGVEHHGFLGSTWFATGGVAFAGAGSGRWQENTTLRGGVGIAPVVTLGLRTRGWAP